MVIFSPQDFMMKPDSPSYLFFQGCMIGTIGLQSDYSLPRGLRTHCWEPFMFYTDLYTKDEVIVQLEVWQESTKVVAIIESTRSIFQEFVSKAVQWVGGPHYFNNSFPGPNLQPRFQSKLKSQLTSSVATASLNQGLKLSIFVVQKATAPKNGVEFRQGSIGTIRGSLATPYDVWRCRARHQV